MSRNNLAKRKKNCLCSCHTISRDFFVVRLTLDAKNLDQLAGLNQNMAFNATSYGNYEIEQNTCKKIKAFSKSLSKINTRFLIDMR